MTDRVLHVGAPRYRLSGMEFDFISLVASGDDPEARVVITKNDPDAVNDKEKDMGDIINKDDLPKEVKDYIGMLEAELAAADTENSALSEQLSKSIPADADAEAELVRAQLAKADPAVRALIEKQQAELDKVTEIAKAEREERLTREYIAKADQLPMLGERAKLPTILRKADELLPAEDAETLRTILKAANAQIRESNLFTSFGVGGGETTTGQSVEAAARELLKSEPALTLDQAKAKVYDLHPEMLAQALNEEMN